MLGRVWVIAGGDERGGAAVHLEAFARSLAVRGSSLPIEWHLLGEGWLSERLARYGVAFRTWPKALRAAITGLSQEARLAAGPLLMHAHGPRANLVARAVHFRTGTDWVTTVHSDPSEDFRGQGLSGWLRRQVNRIALTNARGVFAVSPALANRFGRRGIPVPNAVWFDHDPNGGEADRQALRERLGIPRDTFLVGTVARLDPVKNLPVLIRAIASLPSPDVHLVIAGDGRQRQELEDLARRLAPTRVHLLGFVEDTAPVYRALDVHALVSRSEGTGLSILEAGYYGVPNIGSDVPGIRQLIRDGETGMLVPVGSEAAICEAVIRLRNHPEWARSLVERFRREVLPKFHPDRLREAYEVGYRLFLN